MTYLAQRQVDAMSDADLAQVRFGATAERHSMARDAARDPVTATCTRCQHRWSAFGVTHAGGVLPLGTSWWLLLIERPPAGGFLVPCPRCGRENRIDASALRRVVVLEGRRSVEL